MQGVGFRPHLRRLALDSGVTGVVVNDGDGVWCEIQGWSQAVDEFVARIRVEAPPLARIAELQVSELTAVTDETSFVIAGSQRGAEGAVVSVPPDLAPCPACRAELLDPTDRRHRYPFLCCTDCGPRFTVIVGLPYDRERTTMAPFVLCRRCQQEYDDPDDRRHHAQATCCPDCGPRLWLRSADGSLLDSDDPITEVVAALAAGWTVAVKGVGGYQLLCRTDDDEAVARLRSAKRRAEKPFALLCLDLAQAETIVVLSDAERRALTDPAAPIVLAPRRPDIAVAGAVAPDTALLGVMLPASPLHLLISRAFGSVLVCTSGNISDEPIVIDDAQVAAELGGIAHLILGHDRVVARRADDSVGRVIDRQYQVLRRARGFAPRPVRLPGGPDHSPVVLAVGAHLKNTVGLAAGPDAQLSVHLGDLDHPRALAAFEQTIADLIDLVGEEPDVVVHDLHPEYLSTKFAVAADLAPTLEAQHHHAHLASCLADNGWVADPGRTVLGVTFDGHGWGPDGTLWGGEFLLGDATGYRRLAHLRPTVMPGGEAAIREPWRMALAHGLAAGLTTVLGSVAPDAADLYAVAEQVRRGNGPTTTSMGRLFDAVAALCGVSSRHRTSYEGQAAVQLEQLAMRAVDPHDRYPVVMTSSIGPTAVSEAGPQVEPPASIDPGPMMAAVIQDLGHGIDPATVAAGFHRWMADMITSVSCGLRHHGYDTVALTGGVFQNRLLTELAHGLLEAEGFTVLTHRQVPPNDGGIALGQLAIGRAAGSTMKP